MSFPSPARKRCSKPGCTSKSGSLIGGSDRRTELAANRTVLVAERTYAAWVRTGLMSLAAGVGAKKTLGGVLPEWVVVLTGSVLSAFAAFCFAAAVWRELIRAHRRPSPTCTASRGRCCSR